MRQYTLYDKLIIGVERLLQTGHKPLKTSTRTSPGHEYPEAHLSPLEKTKSIQMMRINHSGEVSAQALYLGQAFFARQSELRQHLLEAAAEEADHLAWCETRLTELQAHKSYLNPLWYTGSFTLGLIASLAGDAWSLGFLAETEKQVSEHLREQLKALSVNDFKSRAILHTMIEDESRHEQEAHLHGSRRLPVPFTFLMHCQAKIMKSCAAYI